MSQSKSRTGLFAMFTVAVLILAACGSNQTASTVSEETQSGVEEPQEASPPQDTEPELEEPVEETNPPSVNSNVDLIENPGEPPPRG